MPVFETEFRNIIFIFFCGLVLLFSLPNSAYAYDKNILIAPTRVVFEGNTRSAVVKLINPNDTPKTFNVSVSAMRMDDSGKKDYVDSPTDEERLAIDMIRYSPRRVTIGPKVWQTVRLMVRKPKDLPPGEYRTQLRVRPVLDNSKTDQANKDQKNISVNIKYAFSISIPVIVRSGDGDVSLVCNSPEIMTENDLYYLETKLERTGLHSAYFDLAAFFTPSGQTKRIAIGTCKGLSIYAENDKQFVRIPLKNTEMITNGKVDIEIRDREKEDNPLMYSNGFEINGMKVVTR